MSSLQQETDKSDQNKWDESTSQAKQGHGGVDEKSTDYIADLSGSDDDVDSEPDSIRFDQCEIDDESIFETPKYTLSGEETESPELQSVDPETQARLEALLEAAGIGKLSTPDGKHFADPEVLRKLTSSVSCALDEAAAALNRMRAENHLNPGDASLVDACSDGDAGTVKKLLEEGKSVNETTEEGDSLLSLACQAGYYELAQVLLAMRANVEDRGIKGDCTPLMEASNAGHLDIVKLLISHNADVNAQSSSGNTPVMYACSGGHEEVAKYLLENGANVEDHNENGHTPLMEAASAGHVGVAKILLDQGAGVNTHSNEFKESALTLACYKGHLDMVRFLLEAGADQEHKTDEMHTALMEASMDGHVEVARLLLDSGAQVNMPADSFESPLTLAACGGHVELAMLLMERGANIEEVNDEGYTALMEGAREGHEEMVALLLSQGADINSQTEETQETALTLACCGGFLEVADFLVKAGADIELGASSPLMEAAQEGRLELVKYLLSQGANVQAFTQTGDTALTYACENGHTDVADILLQSGADLEHESEGGRTPLMKAARAGHTCTVQFLISRGADVNRKTTNNDHTPLSLACAGGHLMVVELLLTHGADLTHKLKDNSTMLIEAAKGGHTPVVELILDYPHSMVPTASPPEVSQLSTPTFDGAETHRVPPHGMPLPVLAEADQSSTVTQTYYHNLPAGGQVASAGRQDTKSQLIRSTNATVRPNEPLTTAELQQVKNAPNLGPEFPPDFNYDFDGALVGVGLGVSEVTLQLNKDAKPSERLEACISNMMKKAELMHVNREEQIHQKQQILEELQRVERELQDKAQAHLLLNTQNQLLIGQQQATDNCLEDLCSIDCGSIIENEAVDDSLPELEKSRESSEGDIDLKNGGPSPSIYLSSNFLDTLPSTCPIKRKFEIACQKGLKTVQNKSLECQRRVIEGIKMGYMEGLIGRGFDLEKYRDLQLSSALGLQLNSATLPYPEQMTEDDHKSYSGRGVVDIQDIVQEPFQSQDSAVISVGVHALSPPEMSTEVDNVTTKIFKSLTQINHLNSLSGSPLPVSPIMGKIPLPAAATGPLQQLPTTPSSLMSPQHYVPTSTVATQYIDPSLPTSSLAVPYMAPATVPVTTQAPLRSIPLIDINSQTDSNHDTALTLACAGGHEELVQLLLSRGAQFGIESEHRDKKGFTPLILAATAGHVNVVEILLNNGAEIEAQSERTKDTPLSLACSGGRFEVVEMLLVRAANKEHRNVSDYTPLSLAASGGYVNIIKLLLHHGAEINSRTGSKLGISPLMLAAMNGHTAAVRLLLDTGSDINAQIETNRNTALTLACFQGRQEVVSLLLDRKANVEHRAKTGLTPLMEAASGGYVEVGRVLLDKGADVNALPVPSSRDTALTIASDKGHYRFVELLLTRGAQVEVKNKKGNSPLWLAASGGHLDVAQLVVSAGAEIDSQDNRKVSCLMAAFRKGHVKVVKWMVKIVTQFPSDQEMTRYMTTLSDAELIKKCQQCLETIRSAKDRQAVEANKNASILLEELDMEKTREESKKAAAARRRERRRKKKKEKQEKKLEEENKKNDSKSQVQEIEKIIPIGPPVATLTTTVGAIVSEEDHVLKSESSLVCKLGGTSHLQSISSKTFKNSISSENDASLLSAAVNCSQIKLVKLPVKEEQTSLQNSSCFGEKPSEKDKSKPEKESRKGQGALKSVMRSLIGREKEKLSTTKEKPVVSVLVSSTAVTTCSHTVAVSPMMSKHSSTTNSLPAASISSVSTLPVTTSTLSHSSSGNDRKRELISHHVNLLLNSSIGVDDHISGTSYTRASNKSGKKSDSSIATLSHRSSTGLSNNLKATNIGLASPKRGAKREEGWKEVVRNSYSSRAKKVLVPSNAISRVIGRGGCNINTIREVSGAVIEVEKQKTVGDRSIIIRGSTDATRHAYQLINMMVKDPEKDLCDIIPKALGLKSTPLMKVAVSIQSGISGITVTATTTAAAVSQGRSTVVSSSVLKTGNLPPSGAISSMAFPSPQPPFSAPVRQAQAVRPGLGMSPAFPIPSTWPNFPVPVSLKKNSSQPALSTSPFQLDSVGTSVNSKSLVSKQLFPPDKKMTSSSSSSSTKTTVSYTTAVLGNGKVTKTIACNNGTTFASKVTESKAGSNMAVTATVSSSNQLTKVTVNTSINNSNPSRSTTLPNVINSLSTRCTSIANGAVVNNSTPAFSSQPGTPTSLSGISFPQPRPSTPPFMSTPPPPSNNVPQDYSPFNNIFSSVTQQSVWGKEKENKGMNFASVTAGKVNQANVIGPGGTNVVNESPSAPFVDAAKAPGYRGSAHISPGSSATLISDPISPISRSHLQTSVSCTPPIGPPLAPIAPPVGSGLRKSSPVENILSTSAPPSSTVPGSLSAINSGSGGGGSNSNSATPSPMNIHHLLQSSATPNLQRPSMEFNSNFVAHSPAQNISGAYVVNNGTSNSYPTTPSSNAVGHPNSQNPIPTIQSTLNPNAPDFSSRTMLNNISGNGGHPPPNMPVTMAQLARIANIQDGTVAFHVSPMVNVNPTSVVVPNFHPSNLAAMVSTQSSASPNNQAQQVAPMAASQTSAMKLNYQPNPQQNNNPLVNEFPQHHLVRPSANMLTNPEQIRLLSKINMLNPRINLATVGINQMSHFAPIMASQRKVNGPHSVSSSSKEDSSSISPVSSPQPSNPSSPLTLSSIPDHSMRPIGEDRKLLRPIGTERSERAHKKNPIHGNMNEFVWRGSYGTSEMQNMQEERLPPMAPNYMPSFGDAMGGVIENNHPMEPNFQPLLQGSHMGEMNSRFPFVNGIHQQMILSQLYNPSTGDIWRSGNNMKLAAGEHGGGISENSANQMPIGLNPNPGSLIGPNSGPIPQTAPEQKMLWNNWNHLQM